MFRVWGDESKTMSLVGTESITSIMKGSFGNHPTDRGDIEESCRCQIDGAPILHLETLGCCPELLAMPLLTRTDALIEGITVRARTVLARQPGYCPGAVAARLRLPIEKLSTLLTERSNLVDTNFLIDVVAALVHECAVDPKWLLTGQCDSALHRQALLIGEDRSAKGAQAIRNLVEAEYRRLRRSKLFSLPTVRDIPFLRP